MRGRVKGVIHMLGYGMKNNGVNNGVKTQRTPLREHREQFTIGIDKDTVVGEVVIRKSNSI